LRFRALVVLARIEETATAAAVKVSMALRASVLPLNLVPR